MASQTTSCSVDFSGSFSPTSWVPSRSVSLAQHTTFHVGGPAKHLVSATSDDEIVAAVQAADDAGEPLLVLSGGSNMLVADSGFDGTVVQIASRGVTAEVSGCAGAVVRVKAGEVWDDLVAACVERDWAGLEALSGVPGLVGATPVQNVGAYGQEVSQTLSRVRTWDRQTRGFKTFTWADCQFGYRNSVFKRSAAGAVTGRYVILEVTFQLRNASLSEPIAYQQLADTLGVKTGARVPAAQVRDAVLELRRSKGMVVDADDRDTWSAGSFFTNPILEAQQAQGLPESAPRFPQPDGRVKTSAAWLIDHAGFAKGFPGSGRARLSSKHVLALTNHDGASAADLVGLARTVREGVQRVFGIELIPEPVMVGVSI